MSESNTANAASEKRPNPLFYYYAVLPDLP